MAFAVAGQAPTWPETRSAEIAEILSRYPSTQSAIMPLLHLAQAERGWVAKEDIVAIAERLELTEAYVESVASFYSMYHHAPVGKYVLTICGNLCCAIVGGEPLVEHIKGSLGIENGETTADGLFTLEVTPECLAACDLGPVIQVNTEYMVKVTPEKFDAFVATARGGGDITPHLEKSEGVFVNGTFHACACQGGGGQ